MAQILNASKVSDWWFWIAGEEKKNLEGGLVFVCLFACSDVNFPYISLHIKAFRILEKGRQAEG